MSSNQRNINSELYYRIRCRKVVGPQETLPSQGYARTKKTIERKKDRYLEQGRYATAEGIYSRFPEQLHLLNAHLLLVAAQLLLQFGNLRPKHFHFSAAQVAAVRKRRNHQPDNNRKQRDRKT